MDRSSKRPLGRLLLDAFKWFDESLLSALAREGWPQLRHSQSLIMAVLDPAGTRISELARRLDISRQAAQQRVTELEGLGLVRTEIDPANASAKLVRLTPDGERNVEAALAAFDAIELELVRRIGAFRLAGLRSALEADWGRPPLASSDPDLEVVDGSGS